MKPTAFFVVLAAIVIQASFVTGKTIDQHADAAVAKVKTLKPKSYNVPTKEEISKMIEKDGFFKASYKRFRDVFVPLVTGPFVWTARTVKLVVTICKLGVEQVKQIIHPLDKKAN